MDNWENVKKTVIDFSSLYDEGIAFIGGIAVFFHTEKIKNSLPNEHTHDGDFAIMRSTFSEMRDIEVVESNPRLGKHQVEKDGIEFDVYEEKTSRLLISPNEIVLKREFIEKIPVACPEHIIVLKLEAGYNRRTSAKGLKDQKDLLRIIHAYQGDLRFEVMKPFLRDYHREVLHEAFHGRALKEMLSGNDHEISKIKKLIHEDFRKLINVCPKSMDLER